MGLRDFEPSDKGSGGVALKFSNAERAGAANGDRDNQSFRKKKNFKRSQHHYIPRESRRSLPGRRPTRRRENLQFLLSLAEGFDFDEEGRVDFCDLIDETASAFSELFLEEEKMATWQAFVNADEDEQLEFLKSASECQNGRKLWMDPKIENLTDVSKSNCLEKCQCAFLKISCKLRHFLGRKHVPKGDLLKVEEDLVEFFAASPSSIYKSKLSSSFQRMLIHAVSQYLDLQARSYDYTQGIKEIRVESKTQEFNHPGMTLVDYLDLMKL